MAIFQLPYHTFLGSYTDQGHTHTNDHEPFSTILSHIPCVLPKVFGNIFQDACIFFPRLFCTSLGTLSYQEHTSACVGPAQLP